MLHALTERGCKSSPKAALFGFCLVLCEQMVNPVCDLFLLIPPHIPPSRRRSEASRLTLLTATLLFLAAFAWLH